ncbi:MAG: NAD+ synthase, partial [Gammaproteobacteria bacterium]
RRARDEFGADAVIFPELTLTGYPPEDLLYHAGLRHQVEASLERVKRLADGIDLIVGYPFYGDGRISNAVSVLRDGEVVATYRKHCLPNYSVFDEKRYFQRGTEPAVIEIKGIPVGLTICEDCWQPGPVAQAAQSGARVIFNISASPFETGKQQRREAVFRQRTQEGGIPIVAVNLIGGQDELVFDGGSMVLAADGRVTTRAPAFTEGLYPVELEWDGEHVRPIPGEVEVEVSEEESAYHAIQLGVRDYARKNGFPGAVIGLSGGIDSALTLAIAVDALGADNVTAVMMPSRYTSDLSLDLAAEQAELLGVEYHTISIESAFEAFLDSLQELFAGHAADTTEENIQARCRGVTLMAISNKTGKLVLTTGNKSEMAVGYATLYGDMAGGFAPIRDCSKTLVYRLAHYRNAISPAIPNRIITRAPSAELASGQKDSDTLPPYDVLDGILQAYVEEDCPAEVIIQRGFDEDTVHRVVRMVKHNEYKRRQAPPGVRISRRSFGRDRRYPITSGYRSSVD